jgi:hypothetical protein
MQHSNPQPAKNLNDLPHLEVPPEICAIIRRMMEKNKTERYPNLNEVLKDFAPILLDIPKNSCALKTTPFLRPPVRS